MRYLKYRGSLLFDIYNIVDIIAMLNRIDHDLFSYSSLMFVKTLCIVIPLFMRHCMCQQIAENNNCSYWINACNAK